MVETPHKNTHHSPMVNPFPPITKDLKNQQECHKSCNKTPSRRNPLKKYTKLYSFSITQTRQNHSLQETSSTDTNPCRTRHYVLSMEILCHKTMKRVC